MCHKAVENCSEMLEIVPEYFKIKEMFEYAVKNHYLLKYMFLFSIRVNKYVKNFF